MKARLMLLAVLAIGGCKPQMGVQPRLQAYQRSDFFSNDSAMRPIPPHTVAQGQLDANDSFHTGLLPDGRLVADFPEPVTPALLSRGRERFGIYCAVCHGLSGAGDGMVVQRGFPAPPSFHSDRLRGAPIGHFVDVMTRGYGIMFPYASRVPAADRWAIAAYIRALQLSQHAAEADLPSGEGAKLRGGNP
ncbi:MAG TPA: cytochrome c [Chthoniobacterales bacterium]